MSFLAAKIWIAFIQQDGYKGVNAKPPVMWYMCPSSLKKYIDAKSKVIDRCALNLSWGRNRNEVGEHPGR